MSEHAIPAASLERLKAAYAQFEQLAMVVTEAMGLGPNIQARIDWQRGVFVTQDDEVEAARANGVAQEAPSV